MPAPGKAFEIDVTDVYRALGYHVVPNVQLSGKQTDLVARREVDGAPPLTLAIECKDHTDPVGNEKVIRFIERVVTQRASNDIGGGVMVSASGFTAAAQAVAEKYPYVSLLSWQDLTSLLLDVRNPLRELVEAYERSAIYGQYVPLPVLQISYSAAPSSSSVTLTGALARWMTQPDPQAIAPMPLFVLGDFGAGKTTLLRHIEYERAKAHLEGTDKRVPLFVSLRDYHDSGNLTSTLRNSFRETYYRDIPAALLWRRMQDGFFYVLLDGFDEMVERSDPARRLELFFALTDVFQSGSPVALTTRPSYFVRPGEFAAVLAAVREHEESLTRPANTAAGVAADADRLRRQLVARRREDRAELNGRRALRAWNPTVMELQPLGRDMLVTLLERHAEDLAAVGYSPAQVMAFIDRTYDLGDLASRPLLLDLIVSAVIMGSLDVATDDSYYGAAGLYEVFTRATLDLDMDKGPFRRGGLSVAVRRGLAEELALAMHEEDVLQIQFESFVDTLSERAPVLHNALLRSDMTREQVATDFATCSFIALTDRGDARFIHKSFRGFFIARRIKHTLKEPFSEMLGHWHEREVLYFLGTFAPTIPGLAAELWRRLVTSHPSNETLRRNLIVAFLHTKPAHADLNISDVMVEDAAYARLTLVESTLRNVAWSNVAIQQLNLEMSQWENVTFDKARLGEVAVHGGNVAASLKDTVVERLALNGAVTDVSVVNGTVERLEVKGNTSVSYISDGSAVGELVVHQGRLLCGDTTGETAVESCQVTCGWLGLDGHWRIRLDAVESIVACDGPIVLRRGSQVRESALVLGTDDEIGRRQLATYLRSDRRSVVVATEITLDELEVLTCGVFGTLRLSRGRAVTKQSRIKAWGVVAMAGQEIERLTHQRVMTTVDVRNIVLVSTERYAAECDGRLRGLRTLADRSRERVALGKTELAATLASLRTAHSELLRESHGSG
jgi:hypothetical protein